MKKIRPLHFYLAISAFAFARCGYLFAEELSRNLEFTLTNTQSLSPQDNRITGQDLRTSFDYGLEKKIWGLPSELDGKGSFHIRHFKQKDEYFWSVENLYAQATWGDMRFRAGRMVLDWAHDEAIWGVSFLNTARNIGPFDPIVEGRTGLMATLFFRKNWEFELFASLVNIPQLYPQYEVENEQVVSHSVWARDLPERVQTLGREIPVRYALEIPPTSEILMQKVMGARLKLKTDVAGDLSLSIGYMPENVLRYDIRTRDTYENANDVTRIRVAPFINHQFVAHFYQRYESKNWLFSNQFGYTNPRAVLGRDYRFGQDPTEVIGAQNTVQLEESQSYFHTHLSYRQDFYSLGVHYFHLTRPEVKFGNNFHAIPYRWKRAIGPEISFSPHERWIFTGSYKYDFLMGDETIDVKAYYRVLKKRWPLEFSIGAQTIRAPKEESYWSEYASMDSFTLSSSLFF